MELGIDRGWLVENLARETCLVCACMVRAKLPKHYFKDEYGA